MANFYAKRHNVNQRVALNELRAGLPIHLSYINNGCVWNIRSIEKPNSAGETWLNLVAPRSRKTRRANAIYATHVRRNEQPKNSYWL